MPPTVAPDGTDALALYWAAEEVSLTVLVYPDRYWWNVRFGGEHAAGGGCLVPRRGLRRLARGVQRAGVSVPTGRRRLYGRRGARNRAMRAVTATKQAEVVGGG